VQIVWAEEEEEIWECWRSRWTDRTLCARSSSYRPQTVATS